MELCHSVKRLAEHEIFLQSLKILQNVKFPRVWNILKKVKHPRAWNKLQIGKHPTGGEISLIVKYSRMCKILQSVKYPRLWNTSQKANISLNKKYPRAWKNIHKVKISYRIKYPIVCNSVMSQSGKHPTLRVIIHTWCETSCRGWNVLVCEIPDKWNIPESEIS